MSRIGNFFKRIFNKENLRKPVFWGALTGVIFIIVVIVATVWNVVDSPTFCARVCHFEQGPTDTWAKSTHSRVACVDCHVEPGFWNALKFRTNMVSWIFLQVTKNPTQPQAIQMPSNASCDVCHKVKRKISPSGDLLIPHDAHIGLRGLKCVDCHRNLVHNAKQTARNKPPMTVCYKCHDGKKASNACSACHTEKAVPEDHKAADWLVIHSDVQKQDPAYCDKCHGWVKGYCTECHQRRPKSHAGLWRTNHRNRIAEVGMRNCLQCHNEQFCIRCHGIMPTGQ
jgi:hypothetical protein